jgi:hypothetical protein
MPIVDRGRRILAGSSKALTRTGEGDPFRRLVAFAMVGVSLLGAFVSYQAAKASQSAGGLDQQATQEQLVVEQSRTNTDLSVADELRLLGPYEEALRSSYLLYAQARRAQGQDPALVRRLDAAYSRTFREAETLGRFFALPPRTTLNPTRIDYDPARARLILKSFDPRFQELRPAATRDAAEREHQRSVEYTRAAALLVGALFFFTLAQLLDARGRRRLLAVAGGTVALAAVVQFLAAV